MSRQSRDEQLFRLFYQTVRAGAPFLSDGGGPFGFDIHAALIVDHLISAYPVDAIIETGTCLGDTTDFLSLMYPQLPVHGIELEPQFAAFTQERLTERTNVSISTGDSSELLGPVAAAFELPLVYLDAHWSEDWPLSRELRSLERALVVIDDYDVEHERFGFDSYGSVSCDIELVSSLVPESRVWVPDLDYDYVFPCLQTGRRSGRAFLAVGVDEGPMALISALRLQRDATVGASP